MPSLRFTPGGTHIVAESGSAEFFTYFIQEENPLNCYIPSAIMNFNTSFVNPEPNNCPTGLIGTPRFLSIEYDQEEKDFINAVKNKDFILAQNVLNNYTQGTQDKIYFKQVQQVNLDRLSNGNEFKLTSADSLILYNIASNYTPINAYARALLVYLKGIRVEANIPSLPVAPPPLIKNNFQKMTLLLSPNPTSGELRI